MIAVSVYSGTNDAIIVSAPQLDNLDLMAVDTAADVTVIDRQTIEDSGAVSVPELLQSKANVLIRNTSGNVNDGQISMRGFGENSGLRTLVLVDGHKINRPDMGRTLWSGIPLSNIDQVEVIRGGQNVLYGDNALAGVVKITTKRGTDAGTQASGTIGSFGYISGYIGHGGSAGNVDYYVGVDGYESDGFRSNSLSRAATLTGSLVWYAGDADMFTFRLSHTDSDQQDPGPLTYDQMMEDPTQSNYSSNDFSKALSTQASLIWEREHDRGSSRITSAYNRRDLNWQLGGIFADNLVQGFSLGPRTKWGGDDSFIIGGVDLTYDTLNFTSYLPADISYVASEAEMDRITVQPYIFAQKTFSEHWILGGGTRYESARTNGKNRDYEDNQILPYVETNRGRLPNPNYKNPPDLTASSFDGVVSKQGWAATASLTREFSVDSSAWIRYDRVYRYPVLDEVASYQGYPLADPLNAALNPETGNQFVAGINHRVGNWQGQGSVYAMLMDNEIVYDPVARLNRNIGETRRMGTELELDWNRRWYGAGTRWTFQESTLQSGANAGNAVPLSPPIYGVCSAWVDPLDAIRFTLSWSYVAAQYQGSDDANVNQKMAAYDLLNFQALIRLADYARMIVTIDNLMDETYASTAYSGAYYPGAGRSFRVGLNLEF
ncbi:TonB-dependent receptor [Pontiellaceae bacterium B12219]|nr:TonB-dependent receptor [Pontiellaceae bacterium B12219]